MGCFCRFNTEGKAPGGVRDACGGSDGGAAKVKRSRVGSISSESIASNLSMHPAIKKLSTNDVTDDSFVKFYLNRRTDGVDDSEKGHEGDDMLVADTFHGRGWSRICLRRGRSV